ncbi:MAG: hypothetical protein ABSC72_01040 [Methylovirgula sp.]|jgi:hypothetical protein
MFRLLARTIGLFLLAGAFAALVIDGTRSIAGGSLSLTSLATTIGWIAPDKVAGLKPSISHISAFLWDPVAVILLKLPTWVILGILGSLIMLATRRRQPKIGFSSR